MRKGSILNQLLKLEEAYAEYEKTGARLDETIKFATLMRCVGGQLKTWLQLQVAETQSYSRLREAITQYETVQNAMILNQDTGGPAPMEIDRITEKGKGKGKFKGKDGGPGKGKGKGDQKANHQEKAKMEERQARRVRSQIDRSEHEHPAPRMTRTKRERACTLQSSGSRVWKRSAFFRW